MTDKPFRVTIEKNLVEYFINKFENKIANTAFQGAKLYQVNEYTNDRKENMVTLELKAAFTEYVEIEGFRLVGYVEFINGEKFVTSFTDQVNWQKELSSIHPYRCDQCGHKRDRKQVVALTENKTGKLFIVGGSCAKRFKGKDLEKMICNIRTVFDDTMKEIFERTKFYRDLAFELAVSEILIKRNGYTSRKKAEMNGDYAPFENLASATQLNMVVYGKLTDHFSKETIEAIQTRKFKLIKTELKEYKDLFNARLEKKWSEFNHNCVALLNGENASKSGYTAYMASQIILPQQKKIVYTALDCPVNKMIDLGEFTVLNLKWTEDQYNSYAALTVANDKNQKLWFKVATTSKAFDQLFVEINETRWTEHELRSTKIKIRGKISAHKENISFAKNIKVVS